MLLAFDDTDSPSGGCTTRLLLDVLAALEDLAPKGLPRLVRLDPNVPWKTRGNGAVCVELVRPEGRHAVIGEWQGLEVRAFPDGPDAAPDDGVLEAVWSAVQGAAQTDATPAAALFPEAPPGVLYAEAVRGFVPPGRTRAWLDDHPEVRWRASGDGRALTGCVGAAAWPGPASSHEFIAYRRRERWGSARAVAVGPLRGLDTSGATFHTLDGDHPVCVPHTPCPVLLGLRGRDPGRLLDAARRVVPLAAGEDVDAWLLWDSNQASGDHVSPVDTLLDAVPGWTVRLDAVVAGRPQDGEGGHVRVPMDDAMGVAFDALAFEPTKGFRAAVRDLLPGDTVTVTGAWKQGGVQLESLVVRSAVPVKVANPVHCGKAMKSRGAGAGYRCACGAVAKEEDATFQERPPGSFEVPVSARRHLHRPLAW